MNVASLKLCRELYEISGWGETTFSWMPKGFWGHSGSTYGIADHDFELATGIYEDIETGKEVAMHPAYDLGYLLRKLPEDIAVINKGKLFKDSKPYMATMRIISYDPLTHGSYVITWTVDNTSEEEALKITRSTHPSVIPVGAEVPAHKSYIFIQKVDGTKASMHRMLVKGHWQSDQNQITSAAKVALDTPCERPKPVVRTPAPIPDASVPASQPVDIPTTGGGK